MNTEQLAKGKKLNDEITDLKNHIDYIEELLNPSDPADRSRYRISSQNPLHVNTYKGTYSDKIVLRSDFYNTEEILLVYLTKAKRKLAELETEFENI